MKQINREADRLVEKASKKLDSADYVAVFDLLRYPYVSDSVLRSLTVDDMRALLSIGEVELPEFTPGHEETVRGVIASYFASGWSEQVYKTIGLSHITPEVARFFRWCGMRDWFRKSVQIEMVYNPGNIVEAFEESYVKADRTLSTRARYVKESPVSFVPSLFLHIYSDPDMLHCLLIAEDNMDFYVESVRENPASALPLIIAETELNGEDSAFWSALKGKENLGKAEAEIVESALSHEVNMSEAMPEKMQLKILERLFEERSESHTLFKR